MIVLVCGGRTYTDPADLWAELDRLKPMPTLLIEGGQRTRDPVDRTKIIGGADYWGQQWAASRGIPCRTVPANWADIETPPVKIKFRPDGRPYNVLAGHNRNQKMVDMAPKILIAAPGGGGTADCIRRARGAGIRVIDLSKAATRPASNVVPLPQVLIESGDGTRSPWRPAPPEKSNG